MKMNHLLAAVAFVFLSSVIFAYGEECRSAENSSPLPEFSKAECTELKNYNQMSFQNDKELRDFEGAKADCGGSLARLKDRAANGNGRDKFILALYGHGLGVSRDLVTAKKLLNEAVACGDELSGHAAMVLGLIYQKGYFPTPWSFYPYSNHSTRACEEPIDLRIARAYFKKAQELHVYADMQINEIEAEEGCSDVADVDSECDLLALGAHAGKSESAAKDALACACAQGEEMAKAERECAVKTLREMITSGTYSNLDLCKCQFGGSGSLTMMCSDREITESNEVLGSFFDKLEGELTGDAKVSAKTLRAATDSFVEARVRWGQYSEGWGGTGASSRYAAALSSEKNSVASLGKARLERIASLQESASEFKAADNKLNEAYRLCQDFLEGKGPGPDGKKAETQESKEAQNLFKDWERKWIAYRDAWVELGAAYAKAKNVKDLDAVKLREGLASEITREQTLALGSQCGNDGE